MKFSFSDDKIEKLRLICEEEYPRKFTDGEAREVANPLFDLYAFLFEQSRRSNQARTKMAEEVQRDDPGHPVLKESNRSARILSVD